MRVVTAEESRSLDARTIASGTPGIVLMRRAAAAVAREVMGILARRPERAGRIVVLAGTGNNGGDGFEVARLLGGGPFGLRVRTLVVGREDRITGDAALTYGRLREGGGAVRLASRPEELETLRAATLIVDALFGTGLSRPVEGLAARAVKIASSGHAFVVAVDVPSGLDAGASEPWEPHVKADVTVTFGYPKRAHVLPPAAGDCGRIVVADIGLLPEITPSGDVDVVTAADVAPLFPRRAPGAHKGTFGRLVVVGGSGGMAGAPGLAARAAHRSGVGLVTVAAPDAVRPVVHTLSPESTTAALETADLSAFDALAVGPGLGTAAPAAEALARAVATERPAVFDADALNLAAGNLALFAARRSPTVLTPHPGEAGRLLGVAAASVNADRVGTARTLARLSGAVVVLKGFRSVVAAPDGRSVLVLAGNPGMASGGAGDVLTGAVGSLLARGLDAWDAARAAAWLHGTAGDLAREVKGEESLIATDLVDFLPGAFAQLAGSRVP